MRLAAADCFSQLCLWFIRGERFAKKDPTIREWMRRDGDLDERIEKTVSWTVRCGDCGNIIDCGSKHFHSDNKRILLMYNCAGCGKARAFFDDGQEYQLELRCPKCFGSYSVKRAREAKKIITDYKCLVCGYEDRYMLDLSDPKPRDEETEKKQRDRFLADQEKYCLSNYDGGIYLDNIAKLKNCVNSMKKHQEKEDNRELYEELARIKKMNIAELKELLSKELIKEDYVQLEFSSPEIGKYVAVSFTIQDTKPGRGEFDSKKLLNKLLFKLLEQTNWRLMSMGLSFRLGIIEGKLRGYEREEELLNLIDLKRIKTRPSVKTPKAN